MKKNKINKILTSALIIGSTFTGTAIAENIVIKNCKGEIIAKETSSNKVNKILIETDTLSQKPTLTNTDKTLTLELIKSKGGLLSESIAPGEWVLCEENLTETKFSKILFLGDNNNLTPVLTVAGAAAAAVGIVAATDDNSSNNATSNPLTQPATQTVTEETSGSSSKPSAKPNHDDACDDTNTIISQSQLGCSGAPNPIPMSRFE